MKDLSPAATWERCALQTGDDLRKAMAEIERLTKRDAERETWYQALVTRHEESEAEVQRLQRSLMFWLPHMPAGKIPPEIETRLENSIWLLAGYDGETEAGAEELGWITFHAALSPEVQK